MGEAMGKDALIETTQHRAWGLISILPKTRESFKMASLHRNWMYYNEGVCNTSNISVRLYLNTPISY